MRHDKRFWTVHFCLGGGFALLCILFGCCEWCRANEFSPFAWLWSRVIAAAQALGGG